MKEKQKIHYSVWKRFVDGIYTCKDIEELLADKKTDRSKDFDEASACLWKTGEEGLHPHGRNGFPMSIRHFNYQQLRGQASESLYLFSKKMGEHCCGCIALHRFERSLFC